MVHPITEGTIGEACDAGSPNCFAECHVAAGAPLPATAGLSECGGNPKDAAISCDGMAILIILFAYFSTCHITDIRGSSFSQPEEPEVGGRPIWLEVRRKPFQNKSKCNSYPLHL